MAEPFEDDLALYRALAAGIDLVALDQALATLLARPAWQAAAACRHADPALFFPARGESTDAAKALCARCPVFDQCDHYAATIEGPLQGIWAGLSPRGRRRAARQAA